MTGDYTLNSPGFLQRNLPQSRRGKANALTILAAIAITIVLSTTIPHFLRLGNILNILEQLSILGFMSIGMTFVMVSGGIDLSTYTIVSAGAVVGATAMVSGGYSPLVGCFLMVLVGLAFGSINGVAIAFGRMIPFMVTLSTLVVAQDLRSGSPRLKASPGCRTWYVMPFPERFSTSSRSRNHHHCRRCDRWRYFGPDPVRALALSHRDQ